MSQVLAFTTAPGRQREIEPYAAPELEFDLNAEIEQLRREPAWQNGRNSKTLVKQPDFRLVLTVLRAGVRIASHRASGRISVQALGGHIRMHLPDRAVDLPAGRLLALDRAVPHDVEALTDSAFLLSIAWPERATQTGGNP
jgi:quercetin dioxygenase-like cupin family protein